MTNPPKRPRDLNQWAKRMLDIATGEVEDRTGQEKKRQKHGASDLKPKSASHPGTAKKA